MNTIQLYHAIRMIKAARNGLLMTAFSVVLFQAADVSAQNPSFGGHEFHRIWVDGTMPEGTTNAPALQGGTQLHLTSAGVYMRSTVYGNGVYFIDDSGGYTVATTAQPEFDGSLYFTVVGAKTDGSMIISPVHFNNPIP